MKELLKQVYEEKMLFVLAFLGAMILFYAALSMDQEGSIKNQLNKIETPMKPTSRIMVPTDPLVIPPSLNIGGMKKSE